MHYDVSTYIHDASSENHISWYTTLGGLRRTTRTRSRTMRTALSRVACCLTSLVSMLRRRVTSATQSTDAIRKASRSGSYFWHCQAQARQCLSSPLSRISLGTDRTVQTQILPVFRWIYEEFVYSTSCPSLH